MDKIIVLLLSVTSIGLIVWWFFGKSKSETVEAEQVGGFQTVNITVDGGYAPNMVALKSGVPAKLVFTRKDPSSCLEEVVLPDFGVSEKLPLNKSHAITINPSKPGEYKFVCGMHMFSGELVVK